MLCAFAASPVTAHAGSYVLGVNAELDTVDGRSVSGFVDYGLTEHTWLSASLARTDTRSVLGGLDTIYADVALEHSFGLVGVRAGAAYWGDNDILDSADLRGSIFLRAKKVSVSFDYEAREFDFIFSPILEPDRTRKIGFSADGIGGSASLQVGEGIRIFASGMRYDYSRNIRLQPRIDLLSRLSFSRLSLMNSLIDHRLSAAMELSFSQRTIDLTFSSWQTAIDGGTVNSIALGFITPSGPASDIGFRLAYDKSENFGDTAAFAISFYYFGN